MTLGPAAFPTLSPIGRSARTKHRCGVCGLGVEPRNSRRHHAACARRKRQDPALWALWRLEMHRAPVVKIRSLLPPAYRTELVLRGYMEHGPVDRRRKFSGE